MFDQPLQLLIMTKGSVQMKQYQHTKYCQCKCKLEMWANAERDGCPAEYRWRPLFNATKFG